MWPGANYGTAGLRPPPPSALGPVIGGDGHRHFPAAAVAGHSPALMRKGKVKVPGFLARLRGRLGIRS